MGKPVTTHHSITVPDDVARADQAVTFIYGVYGSYFELRICERRPMSVATTWKL
jgi:hypothetical protein